MHAADLLSKRAELTPDRVALVERETGCRFTYAELNVCANRLANFLRDRQGVQPGDRVSILAKNGVVYIDLLYGLPKIGAVFAPFNGRLTAHELACRVDDLAPKVLICEPDFAAVVDELRVAATVEYVVALRGATLAGALVYRMLDFGLRRYMGESASFINGIIFVTIVIFLPYGIVGTWRMTSFRIKQGWDRPSGYFGLSAYPEIGCGVP